MGSMTEELYLRILEQAAGRVFHLTLNGCGEALLHPRLPAWIHKAKQAGIPQTFLHTNATLLRGGRARALLESGLDNLMISFDSEFPEEYEKSHVGASYEKTLANILGFLELKKRLGLSRPMVAVKILRVFEDRAYDPDPDPAFLDRFRGLPVDRIFVSPIHATGSYVNDLAEVGGISRKAIESSRSAVYSRACLRPFTGLFVSWDGKAAACFQDYRNEYVAGDLNEQSLDEVWNGPRMRDLRRRLLDPSQGLPQPCAVCSVPVEDREAESGRFPTLRPWLALPRALVRYHAPRLRRGACSMPFINRKIGSW